MLYNNELVHTFIIRVASYIRVTEANRQVSQQQKAARNDSIAPQHNEVITASRQPQLQQQPPQHPSNYHQQHQQQQIHSDDAVMSKVGYVSRLGKHVHNINCLNYC